MGRIKSGQVFNVYKALYEFYGPQGWWPAETPLEVIVGAILTQNTAWAGVEKAISNLKAAGLLNSFSSLKNASEKKLARLIRPAGYYNLKAGRLKSFINFLNSTHNGSVSKLGGMRKDRLRGELLSVNGIGPETCDSILLYALGKKSFVVDAYTRRIFSRHGFFKEDMPYEKIQKFFEYAIPPDIPVYNEYHALIVRLGKDHCRRIPRCGTCPLGAMGKRTCKYEEAII